MATLLDAVAAESCFQRASEVLSPIWHWVARRALTSQPSARIALAPSTRSVLNFGAAVGRRVLTSNLLVRRAGPRTLALVVGCSRGRSFVNGP